MKVTIRDVAVASGTSISTVSRVISGSAPVKKKTKAAVEKAIDELGYRPDYIARALKTKATKTVGLLLNDITNPFYASIAKGAEEEANVNGYMMVLSNINEDPKTELNNLKLFHDRRVDGILFGPTGKNLKFIQYLNKLIPLVQIDRKLEKLDAPAVIVDNEQGSFLAVNELIAQGHKSIGVIKWKAGVHTPQDRFQGYLKALSQAGIEFDPSIIIEAPDFAPRKTSDFAKQLIDRENRPTAIFVLNNQLGIGALRAIKEANLEIPKDIALLVFDDIETFSLTTPPISAISQPAFSIGKKAMKLLLNRIKNENTEYISETVILPTKLVRRGSI
jgi:LacI family transcriptional regulator